MYTEGQAFHTLLKAEALTKSLSHVVNKGLPGEVDTTVEGVFIPADVTVAIHARCHDRKDFEKVVTAAIKRDYTLSIFLHTVDLESVWRGQVKPADILCRFQSPNEMVRVFCRLDILLDLFPVCELDFQTSFAMPREVAIEYLEAIRCWEDYAK